MWRNVIFAFLTLRSIFSGLNYPKKSFSTSTFHPVWFLALSRRFSLARSRFSSGKDTAFIQFLVFYRSFARMDLIYCLILTYKHTSVAATCVMRIFSNNGDKLHHEWSVKAPWKKSECIEFEQKLIQSEILSVFVYKK